jgi:hypothetical protein
MDPPWCENRSSSGGLENALFSTSAHWWMLKRFRSMLETFDMKVSKCYSFRIYMLVCFVLQIQSGLGPQHHGNNQSKTVLVPTESLDHISSVVYVFFHIRAHSISVISGGRCGIWEHKAIATQSHSQFRCDDLIMSDLNITSKDYKRTH